MPVLLGRLVLVRRRRRRCRFGRTDHRVGVRFGASNDRGGIARPRPCVLDRLTQAHPVRHHPGLQLAERNAEVVGHVHGRDELPKVPEPRGRRHEIRAGRQARLQLARQVGVALQLLLRRGQRRRCRDRARFSTARRRRRGCRRGLRFRALRTGGLPGGVTVAVRCRRGLGHVRPVRGRRLGRCRRGGVTVHGRRRLRARCRVRVRFRPVGVSVLRGRRLH